MAPQRNFSVGTYNIRGLKSNEQLVAEWIQRSGIAVAAITETWLKPEDDVDYFITEHVALEPRCPNGKGYGGVALSIHPLLRYQVLKKCTTTIYQYIAIKSQGISIVGLYLSPAATAQQTEECFKEIGDLICSPFIIMGISTPGTKTGTKVRTDVVDTYKSMRYKENGPSIPLRKTHTTQHLAREIIVQLLTSSSLRGFTSKER
ncbi:hypothetical protein BWQ96_10830 [Gracilariopsis chorda]|uniref:Endonuclease/exonuclease/phosphatase domain-containing protein n=1 Tax=Gracilariopsis chorda TaxID=448386 RepID=A0A2V3IBK1_9FLOR|nr:hypothetical protein BWQ96_10830 [Gracilariopsis chorda]|eukprot:PXF39483.1 hypothetical protein BWQ96_10830 [Gracilariopsis chorda]